MVLKPRAEAPLWDGLGNPNKAAKCLKFAPESWGSDEEDDQLEAASICNGNADGKICPIRAECLAWSLINNEQYCVYGGMLPHDRRKMRLARRADPHMEIEWHPPTPRDPLDVEPEPELDDEEE